MQEEWKLITMVPPYNLPLDRKRIYFSTSDTKKPMLIGIAGRARSGKDTIADFLCKNYNFKKMSFADPLKKLVMDLFDMTEEQCYGNLKETIDERYQKTPRWLLQHVGIDVFRKLYPNIWIDYTMRKYKSIASKNIVIPDVRFINELEVIKSNGGQVWKIIRQGFKNIDSGISGHASETELEKVNESKFDLVLKAPSGRLDLLYKNTEKYLNKMVFGYCSDCNSPMNYGEAKTFTVCDSCWTKSYGKIHNG